MPQAVRIFVFVCLTFLVYITSKGQLSTYLGFFRLGSNSATSGNGQDVLEGYGKTTKTITQLGQEGVTAAKSVQAAAEAAHSASVAVQQLTGDETLEGENAIAAAIAKNPL